MKQVFSTFLKFMNGILYGLIALCGFSACGEEGVDEYGCPYADFEIKGKVTTQDGQPIQGINVRLNTHGRDPYDYELENPELLHQTRTKADGTYNIIFRDIPTNKLHAHFEDIDGEENGSFEEGHTYVYIQEKEYTGRQGWFSGKTDQNIDFQMIEKPVSKNE